MSESFLPDSESHLIQWANNFVSYAVTHTVQTGISTTALTEFTNRRDTLVKWKPNGNRAGAMYEVWVRYGTNSDWKYVESVIGITFTDKNAPTYEKVTYKVRSKVDGKFSKVSADSALTTSALAPVLQMEKAA